MSKPSAVDTASAETSVASQDRLSELALRSIVRGLDQLDRGESLSTAAARERLAVLRAARR